MRLRITTHDKQGLLAAITKLISSEQINITGAEVQTTPDRRGLITVRAAYTDGHSTAEAVTSVATTAVVNVNDAATGSVRNLDAFVAIPSGTGAPFTEVDIPFWGELVPWGMTDLGFNGCKSCPWRAGANENTTFTVSHDVKVLGSGRTADISVGSFSLIHLPKPPSSSATLS